MDHEKGSDRDLAREPSPVVPETKGGTTAERDFGKSDRYANKDNARDDNFRTMGDGTDWDNGRGASIGHGTAGANDVRSAEAEAPGVKTKEEKP
jgi:hypothetical protein